jgi:hypothetical protein
LHDRFLDTVRIGTVDAYLNHATPDTINLDNHKLNLGNSLNLIRSLNNITQVLEAEGRTAERLEELDRIQTALTASLNTLPRLDDLQTFNLTADPDVFFEILCINIKNNLISFQGWLQKTERINVNLLKKRLEFLKQDFLGNEEEIFDCERRLTGIHDKNLSSKVSCFKIFKNLNNERMTPAYLSLVKK